LGRRRGTAGKGREDERAEGEDDQIISCTCMKIS
jgi:hypothetical protein